MSNLNGKVAIVTGAASGIGKATAMLLAQRGAAVVVADRHGDAAAEVAAAIEAVGGSAAAVTTDVAHEDQIEAMVATAVDRFGGLDILHNNAAILDPEVVSQDIDVTQIDADVFARVLQVNVGGYLLGAKHAIPHMIARGGGAIINTASSAGVQAEYVRPMYGTSKAAVIGMTRNIATRYGKDGIRCIAVSPGLIMTEAAVAAFPQEIVDGFVRHSLANRAGVPEDVAHLVAFLASDEAAYINGINISIDGGLSVHFPNYADDRDAMGG
ncbi:unannotated protein [freshwater metagenome]|uniref:Unannotated protein n=1 Tax=freshwater metagenome TaxID=449393 RepID=A0A6J7IXT5_9ZZZZ|nr:glucose 1-dehydrogenase [Actinomycetota bacterium]